MFKVIACGACQHCFRREISTCVACRSGTPLTAVGIQRQRAPTAPAWTPCRWPSTAPCPPPPLLSPPLLSSLCHSPPQPLQVRRTGHKSVSNAVQAESVLTQCVLGLRVAACVTAVSQPVASPTVNVGTLRAAAIAACRALAVPRAASGHALSTIRGALPLHRAPPLPPGLQRRSRHTSDAPSPTQVSSQRSHAASTHLHQLRRSRNNAHERRNASCACWTRHMRAAWQHNSSSEGQSRCSLNRALCTVRAART